MNLITTLAKGEKITFIDYSHIFVLHTSKKNRLVLPFQVFSLFFLYFFNKI